MNWKELVKIIAPIATAAIPGGAAFTPIVIGAIQLAEDSGQDGHTKREIGKRAVEIAMDARNAVAAKKGLPAVPTAEAVEVYDAAVDAIVQGADLWEQLGTGSVPPPTP